MKMNINNTTIELDRSITLNKILLRLVLILCFTILLWFLILPFVAIFFGGFFLLALSGWVLVYAILSYSSLSINRDTKSIFQHSTIGGKVLKQRKTENIILKELIIKEYSSKGYKKFSLHYNHNNLDLILWNDLNSKKKEEIENWINQ